MHLNFAAWTALGPRVEVCMYWYKKMKVLGDKNQIIAIRVTFVIVLVILIVM